MTRTAVAAPPAEPHEDLFAFIDGLTITELTELVDRITETLRHRNPDADDGSDIHTEE